jgi:predicted aconitase
VPQLNLTDRDQALLSGIQGPGKALAMRIVVGMAEVVGAERLLDIEGAHVDGCLYHGPAGLEFAERLAAGGARVSVPTTLNVGSLDLLHPERYRGDADTARRARRLMDAYVAIGCRPTWTCAPYQLPEARPAAGRHVAWAESNAIVFANSVLGARTDRYGDFIDICAAITGRAPEAGLHLDRERRGEVVFRLQAVPGRLLDEDVLYPVLGHLVGLEAGRRVPVLEGLPPSVSEDRLKALGAAAASSGGVGLVHVVGVTPEAPTLDAALGGGAPIREVRVTTADLVRSRDALTTAAGEAVGAVSVGTPHLSVNEFDLLTPLLHETPPVIPFYVSTARQVLAEVEARGWLSVYERAGVRLVVDTCTYVTPIMERPSGAVMTNSAKWAYYAPGNLGVEVIFGSMEECVRSAGTGRLWRDPGLWGDG